MDEDLLKLVNIISSIEDSMKQMSDIIDLLFAYVARHCTAEEMKELAEMVKKPK